MTHSGGPQSVAGARDSIRATLDSVFATPEFDWERAELPDIIARLRALLQGINRWFENLMVEHPVIGWLLLAALALLAIALIGHLGYLAWRGIASAREPSASRGEPLPQVRNAAWHLAEARRLRDAGQLAEALAHRFISLLLELDRRKALRFHPSKTPAEYVHEARLAPEGHAALTELVGRLYRFLFGGDTPSPEDFDVFDRRADELGEQVAPG